MRKIINKLCFLVSALSFFPLVVRAATIDPTPPMDITELIFTAIKFLIGAAASLSVLFIIIGGAMYMLSAGNKERSTQAKNTLTYAVGGLILVILSFAIVNIIIKNFPGFLQP